VLRAIAHDPPDLPTGDGDADVSVRTGLAPWAVSELRRLLGDETEPAAEALAERARLSLRVNGCRASVDEVEAVLRDAGLDPTRGRVDEGCLLVDRPGDPSELPGFREGAFAVQDEASAFVATLVGARPGERIADVCAGPGGKTAAIACAAEDGLVVGGDLSVRRAGLVARAAQRLGVRAAVLAQDARAPALRGVFDRVLVDAPCSGLGSARRRPELLWRGAKEELSSLARLQVAIASSATDLLRPGGTLVYSACTFPRAETDAAVDAFLRHRPDLTPVATDGPDGRAERHRLWPHRHGCDAMFAAAFHRGESTPG
jgi:16S rRNA (cytosine967-C5)-methyltransferase